MSLNESSPGVPQQQLPSSRPQGSLTRGSSNGAAVPPSHMDSTITRLLIATKQLLEGLAKWSRGEVTDDAISGIYVKLGNDFNVACAAFAKENIGMSELLSVPTELRVCLESCLSDPPSQATLERHLPKVRQIIIGLLTGLREKQRLYRDGVAEKRAREMHNRDPRGSDDSRRGSESSVASTSVQRSQTLQNPPITPNSAGRSREELRKFVSQAQSIAPPPPPPIVARAGSSHHMPPPTVPAPRNEAESYPSFAKGLPTGPRPKLSSTRATSLDDTTPATADPSLSRRSSRGALRASEGGIPINSDTFSTTIPPSRSNGSLSSLSNFPSSSTPRHSGERARAFSPPPPSREYEEPVPVPSTPTTIPSRPLNDLYPQAYPTSPPPGVRVRPPSSSMEEPFTPTFEASQNAAQLESLEALKQSENLTRRASKRYSAYAINKMTGTTGSSPSRGASSEGSSGGRGARGESSRSAGRELSAQSNGVEDKRNVASTLRKAKSEFRTTRGPDGERLPPPPVPSVPHSLSAQDLRYPTIEEEPGSPAPSSFTTSSPELPPPPPPPSTFRPTHTPSSSLPYATLFPPPSESSLPTPSSSYRKRESSENDSASAEPEVEYPISVFLQIGRDVKKVRLEAPPTNSVLRVLFIERFQYNPGHADFPDIYMRDPTAGVQYELEDMSDVRNGSVISLNIDTVEQVKQHIDQGLAGLTQEIKELRSTVTAMRRASAVASSFSPIELQASPVLPRPSPSERQFQDAAQKVLKSKQRLGSLAGVPEDATLAGGPPPSASADQPQPCTPISPTSSIGGDARALHVVGTLKTQHEEVQSLRRELGVLRQVYVDFAGQTKSLIGNLRTQTSHVETIAATKVSTARAFIDVGKVKLETETTELIARGDTLQDAIDDMRADISMRKIRPRPQQIAEIAASLASVRKGRDELVTWIATVKPSWKTTWSDELETIIGEQKLLEAQEGFLSELEVDLQEAASIFNNIQQVSKQPKGPRGVVRDFAPTLSEHPDGEGGGGLSTVLLEVRGLQPDPERRLEAIEKAERARELDLASRTDEFADELGGFVQGQRLKKSGGIEETERLRQAKSEATLRAMFGGGGAPES